LTVTLSRPKAKDPHAPRLITLLFQAELRLALEPPPPPPPPPPRDATARSKEGAADLFSFLRRTVEARPPPPPPPPPPRDVLLHRAKRAALAEHGWATSAADAAGGDGRPELCRTGRRTELFTALHLRYVEGLLLCFTRMGKFWYGTVRCGLLSNRLFYV